MRIRFHIWKALTWVVLLVSCHSSCAMTPQTGIYWDPRRPGTALYVERQNGTIFVAVYGYANSDGSPEFYVASGPIIPSLDADFINYEGLYPIEGFAQPLYRVPSGSCLACPYTAIAPAERVGVLRLVFLRRQGFFAKIFFDSGRTYPTPNDEYGVLMQRFNFALGGVPTTPEPFSMLFDDLRGEWVFTDQSDPARPAWRFHFTTREDGADLSDFGLRSSVAFRDTSRNAVMYCYSPDLTGLTSTQIRALPSTGCELRQDGVALFWTQEEVSIDEFYGNLGSAPPRSEGIFRSSRRVIGRRISD